MPPLPMVFSRCSSIPRPLPSGSSSTCCCFSVLACPLTRLVCSGAFSWKQRPLTSSCRITEKDVSLFLGSRSSVLTQTNRSHSPIHDLSRNNLTTPAALPFYTRCICDNPTHLVPGFLIRITHAVAQIWDAFLSSVSISIPSSSSSSNSISISDRSSTVLITALINLHMI